MVLEELVMNVGVPSSGVVDNHKTVHLMKVAVVAPTIESMAMMSMVSMVPVVSVVPMVTVMMS
jgi:hypothetical protein